MEEEIKKSADTEEIEENEEIKEEVVVELEQEEPEEIDEEEEKNAAMYLDKLQRTMAEFDNYRKRTTKEKNRMYDAGLIDTIEALLPVIDNFERALEAPCEDKSYVKGMELIYKQMLDLLKSLGVSIIETKDTPFDTSVHNAVMHIEDEDLDNGEIVEEFQKGYMYKEDKVIRYSMVKVAN